MTRARVWVPVLVMVVVVKDDVSLMTVTLGEMAVVEGTEELEDCAETETTKEAMRRKGRTALENMRASHGLQAGGGDMMVVDEGKKEEVPTTEDWIEANKWGVRAKGRNVHGRQ